jgi:hypothetical protein
MNYFERKEEGYALLKKSGAARSSGTFVFPDPSKRGINGQLD